jgi:hypothetical protein
MQNWANMEADKTTDIPNGSTLTVRLINPVNFGYAEIGRFMTPPVPGFDYFPKIPSLCFLLEHPSGRKLVWDLVSRLTPERALESDLRSDRCTVFKTFTDGFEYSRV